MFYIWCLAGAAELVGASEGLHGQVLAGLQLVAEVQLELYPEKTWLDAASRAVCFDRTTVS